MKVTALVAAVSLALGGLLAGCGEQAGNGAAGGGSSASGSSGSSSSGATGTTPRSPGGMSGSGSANQDEPKRAPGSAGSK